MTVVEYIRRKNAIIEKACGVTLVPEDQIAELPRSRLSMDTDAEACPYCVEYLLANCKGCPMQEAENMCGGDDDNTYDEVTYKIGFFTEEESPIYDDLSALVNQFNEELENEKT